MTRHVRVLFQGSDKSMMDLARPITRLGSRVRLGGNCHVQFRRTQFELELDQEIR